MRSILAIGFFPILFAGLLYVFAMAPATSVIETIGARIGAQQTVAGVNAICYSPSAARHFGVSQSANEAACNAQEQGR